MKNRKRKYEWVNLIIGQESEATKLDDPRSVNQLVRISKEFIYRLLNKLQMNQFYRT